MDYYMNWLTLMNYVSCLYDEGIINLETKNTMDDNLMRLKKLVLDAEEMDKNESKNN